MIPNPCNKVSWLLGGMLSMMKDKEEEEEERDSYCQQTHWSRFSIFIPLGDFENGNGNFFVGVF